LLNIHEYLCMRALRTVWLHTKLLGNYEHSIDPALRTVLVTQTKVIMHLYPQDAGTFDASMSMYRPHSSQSFGYTT